ncbi:MAG: chromosomal replication initiator protein DnaA [Thermodesulfobacteriota bacterium]
MSKKKEIWEHITSRFSSKLRPKDFETWFSPISLKTLDNDLAVIEVPNRFFAEWIRERYLKDLRAAFKDLTDLSPEIHFSVRNCPPENSALSSLTRTGAIPSPKPDLYPDMTFDRFVREDSNAFAYFSCLELAEKSPRSYAPLYLFSERSAGKTHLLHAVGNRMMEISPDSRVRYVHSDRFTTEFTQALRAGQIHSFRDLFTELDILLFDDVHVLSGRSQTQQEFTFALNALLRKGKTVVVAGRVAPFRLEDMTPRLKSILSWGLLAEIQPPGPEMRIQVIKQHAALEDLILPDDIIFFLAKSNDDMKNLFRHITRLQTYISLNGGNISLSAVRNLIRDQAEKGVDIKDIQAVTAGYFKISISDLLSDKRRRPIAYARRMAMYLCKEHTQNSYKKISSAFSKKDHSTVIYALKRIKEELSRNEEVKEDLKNLENLIRL